MLALFLSAEDKKQIAKMVVWSWQFWVPFMIAFLAACLFIWKGIGSVAKSQATKMFNEEMTNRIKLEFQEPRIREIIVQAASIEATNMIQSAIAPEIAKFQRGLSDLMNDMPTNLYSRLTFETISLNDSNRVYKLLRTNEVQAFIKLQFAPVRNSLQGVIIGDWWPRPLEQPLAASANVLVIRFSEGWNFAGTSLSLQYVKDVRETNLVRVIEFQGTNIFFNEILVDLKPMLEE